MTHAAQQVREVASIDLYDLQRPRFDLHIHTSATMVKEKKKSLGGGDADTSVVVSEVSYEDKLKFTSVIAKPMASKKLTKKVRRTDEGRILLRQAARRRIR